MTKIFLRNLNFGHNICFVHAPKKWTKRFTWLKIYRPIFNLDTNIVTELTIQWLEFFNSLFGSVFGLRRINKGASHYNSAVWLQGICQHVCTISMVSSIILRASLAFGICFDQKAPKVWNVVIYFSNFVVSKLNYLWV